MKLLNIIPLIAAFCAVVFVSPSAVVAQVTTRPTVEVIGNYSDLTVGVIGAIVGGLSAIGSAIILGWKVLIPIYLQLRQLISEAHANSASAVATADAAQISVTRISNRINAAEPTPTNTVPTLTATTPIP